MPYPTQALKDLDLSVVAGKQNDLPLPRNLREYTHRPFHTLVVKIDQGVVKYQRAGAPLRQRKPENCQTQRQLELVNRTGRE